MAYVHKEYISDKHRNDLISQVELLDRALVRVRESFGEGIEIEDYDIVYDDSSRVLVYNKEVDYTIGQKAFDKEGRFLGYLGIHVEVVDTLVSAKVFMYGGRKFLTSYQLKATLV